MINNYDIIKSVSNVLYENIKDSVFNCKITDDEDQRQQFINDEVGCFFIGIHSTSSNPNNLHFNLKNITLDISYFPVYNNRTKSKLYDLEDILKYPFSRSIKVKDRVLHIKSTDCNILKDDIGYWLNFSMDIEYLEQVYFDKNDSEVMKSLNTKLGDVINIESEV